MLRLEHKASTAGGKSATAACALWQGFSFVQGYQDRASSIRPETKPNLHDRRLN